MWHKTEYYRIRRYRIGTVGAGSCLCEHIYTVSQKRTPPKQCTNDNFNNSCPIPAIFGTDILVSKYVLEMWFNMQSTVMITSNLKSSNLQ